MTQTTEAPTPAPTWCPAIPLGRDPHLTAEERADIARWVVTMRRAHDASTPQVNGHLRTDDGYCCLGLWCEVGFSRGLLAARTNVLHDNHPVEWQGLAVDGQILDSGWQGGALPEAVTLGGLDDPDLIRFAPRDTFGDDPADLDAAADDDTDWSSASAAGLNDEHELNFAQIADMVAWSFGVTPEELAAAELAPRVPIVEGGE